MCPRPLKTEDQYPTVLLGLWCGQIIQSKSYRLLQSEWCNLDLSDPSRPSQIKIVTLFTSDTVGWEGGGGAEEVGAAAGQ